MSVRKRVLKSGKICWQVDYTDQSGKRRSKQYALQRDAKAFDVQARGQIAIGTHVADAASCTVAEAGEIWIKDGQREGLEATTITQRDQHVRLHIVPRIGGIKLSKLSTPMVEEFKDSLIDGLSRALARAVLTSFKGIIRVAQIKGLIGSNPAAAVRITKRRTETVVTVVDDDDEGEVKILGKDQIRAMLAKASEIWPLTRIVHGRWVKGVGRPERHVVMPWCPMFITTLFTGLRASELRGLTWNRVDFDNQEIKIRQRADRYGRIGPPKTATSRREVAMAPAVMAALREWRLVCPESEMDLVFPAESSRVILHTNLLNQGFKPLLVACGIEESFGYHVLRHTAASLFIEQGWQPKKIQTVMGHSSITVTYDRYGHLFPSPDDDAEAMAQMQARLLG
ncbi:MAG: tyrosine-type recombinase/integrase [Rhodospirillaceae bacterium]|nr:tyrosine-type recombinase/integrase [Rhodospirillales bacterium]